MAGGLGSRLGDLTQATPKPLLPVAGRPFLAYLLDWLARAGLEEIIVSTGYLADSFSAFLATMSWRDPYGRPIRIAEAKENTSAGTAGALALMGERLEERFLVVNGDTLFDCDLVGIIAAAEQMPRGSMLLTVREVEDTGRYGRVDAQEGGRIVRFAEKSGGGPGPIYAGISVLDRSVLDLIESVPFSLERDVYPRLVEEGRLFATQQSGYFIDIGLPETYGRAQTELPAGDLSLPKMP